MNHRSAPIEVRESVAFESSEVREALNRLRSNPSIQESVILSTCNRVEVVAAAWNGQSASEEIKAFLAEQKAQKSSDSLDDHVYTHHGPEAVRHLFRVAASLDSMVIGEPQILGQLKQHYNAAQEAGTVGTILHRLFHRSFSVAKRVRNETAIASRAVSVSSVAVELAKRIFDRLDDKTVMLIGAGKMGDLMARHLQRSGVKSLMVTNRTFDRAVELAGRIHGSPILFEDFPRYLTLADLVIGCTGSPEILIGAATVDKVLRERKQKAMFFIDIGERRNFDPGINEIDNVYLYNIDDLQGVAEENLLRKVQRGRKGGRDRPRGGATFHGLDSVFRPGSDDYRAASAAGRDTAERVGKVTGRRSERPLGKATRGLGGHDHGDDEQDSPRSNDAYKAQLRRRGRRKNSVHCCAKETL